MKVWETEEKAPQRCPSCGSTKLVIKVSTVTGLRKIKDGDIVRCRDCNWTRKYMNLKKE